MNPISPALMQRLHRAAAEIEGQARSRARHPPSQLARAVTGAGLNWSFGGSDLIQVLRRNGIEVIERGNT